MAQIRIDIASEFKEKGFKKAEKASTMLDRRFKALAKTFVAVFSVRQVLAFGRASVNAFASAEKEAAQLRAQLTGINLAFATPVVDEYIDKLELATGLTGDQLVPAFNALSRATEDITTAQKLLNLALDISFATGTDLNKVSGALQRAYKGEVTALTKLRLGYTNVELKGKKFEKVVKELERRFGGSTELATQTYGTTVDRLKRSIEQAQESIGKGFVSGLKKSGKSIEDFQDDIKDLGFALGEASGAFSNFIVNTSNDIDKFLNSSAYLKFRDFIDFLFRQANFVVTGEMLVKNTPAMKEVAERRKREVANRAELRQRNMILKQEKINAEKRKKIQDEEEKRRRLEAARKRAETIFDMENIQIVAALQGKIDGEQRMRLVTLLALNTDNIKAAEKLADIVVRLNAPALESLGVIIKTGDSIDDVVRKLIGAQANLAGLQLQAEDFPELDNPFDPWEETLKRIMLLLDQLEAKQKKQPTMQQEVPAPQFTQKNNFDGSGGADSNTSSLSSQANKLATERLEALQKFYENERLATSGMGGVSRGEYAGSGQYRGNVGSGMGGVARGEYSPSVTVNVAGNVVTENDLVRRITDSLYGQQKSGKQVVYRATDL